MFKPVIVANKSWWVPEKRSLMLAVRLDNPEDYHQAILWKMETLVDELGLAKAIKVADKILRQEGALALDQIYNAEHLVTQVLENSLRIGMAIKEGDPEIAQPADPKEALAMVEAQAEEMTWATFLT
jgi:hypothetical protein